MQETQIRFLVQKDITHRRTTKPMHHNYWACAPEPVLGSYNYWAYVLQLPKPTHPRVRAPQQEKSPQKGACAP